jgi:protein-tyrosine phosphatase
MVGSSRWGFHGVSGFAHGTSCASDEASEWPCEYGGVAAEARRRVGLDGPANFRDLGGYPAGTRFLRRGRVFRSDSLSHMSDSDVRRVVDELGVATVVDLRAGHEVETYGHGPLGAAGVVVHHMPIADETRRDRVERPPDAPDPATLTLDAIYLIMLDHYADRFVGVLRMLADEAKHPIVFHCAAGKDRTGIVAALLLSVLGVDDETIAADYALTSEHIEELLERHRERAETEGAPVEVSDAFLAAEVAVMRNLLVEMRNRYGSAEAYLEAHGLEPEAVAALRASLLTGTRS